MWLEVGLRSVTERQASDGDISRGVMLTARDVEEDLCWVGCDALSGHLSERSRASACLQVGGHESSRRGVRDVGAIGEDAGEIVEMPGGVNE